MSAGLAARLRAMAYVQDSYAARITWKGNAKYSVSPIATERLAYHQRAASDLRQAAALAESAE